jgi:hypothetical protein
MLAADRFELLSLDPNEKAPPAPDLFYGYQVLGRTVVTDPTARIRLIDELHASMQPWGNRGKIGCFYPRHGMHLVVGEKIVKLIICFECAQVIVFEPRVRAETLYVTEFPKPVFDDVLTAHGVPLPWQVRLHSARTNGRSLVNGPAAMGKD